jgi:hypothetical protein
MKQEIIATVFAFAIKTNGNGQNHMNRRLRVIRQVSWKFEIVLVH